MVGFRTPPPRPGCWPGGSAGAERTSSPSRLRLPSSRRLPSPQRLPLRRPTRARPGAAPTSGQGAAGPADAPARATSRSRPAGRGTTPWPTPLRGECLEGPPKYPYPRVRAHPAVVLRRRLLVPRRPEEHRARLVRPAPARAPRRQLAVRHRRRRPVPVRERVQRPAHPGRTTTTTCRASACTATCGTGTSSACTSSASGRGTFSQDLAPLPIDQNKADLLNAFVDVKSPDLDGNPAYVRVGRQELLFGSQRLISPLDWANTRRTFQGVRGFRQTEKWDFDLFWVAAGGRRTRTGSTRWTTTRTSPGRGRRTGRRRARTIDAYYLMLDNTNRDHAARHPARRTVTRHTIGGRYAGDVDERTCCSTSRRRVQFGTSAAATCSPAMATAGVWATTSRTRRWNPTVVGVLRLRQRRQGPGRAARRTRSTSCSRSGTTTWGGSTRSAGRTSTT